MSANFSAGVSHLQWPIVVQLDNELIKNAIAAARSSTILLIGFLLGGSIPCELLICLPLANLDMQMCTNINSIAFTVKTMHSAHVLCQVENEIETKLYLASSHVLFECPFCQQMIQTLAQGPI